MSTREELAREAIDFYTELFRERDTAEGLRWFPRLVLDEMTYGFVAGHWKRRSRRLFQN